MSEHKANFLWPPDAGSIEEAGYEFVNGATESYRQIWWRILLDRCAAVPEKHTDHSKPCPTCGAYQMTEEEAVPEITRGDGGTDD